MESIKEMKGHLFFFLLVFCYSRNATRMLEYHRTYTETSVHNTRHYLFVGFFILQKIHQILVHLMVLTRNIFLDWNLCMMGRLEIDTVKKTDPWLGFKYFYLFLAFAIHHYSYSDHFEIVVCLLLMFYFFMRV